MCYTLLFPKGVSIFVSYELKTLNDNECKDFYYLYTQIRYDDPSAIHCSDLKGALGCFGVVFFSFHFHFKVSKIALISHSLPNIFRHKLFNFINWFFYRMWSRGVRWLYGEINCQQVPSQNLDRSHGHPDHKIRKGSTVRTIQRHNITYIHPLSFRNVNNQTDGASPVLHSRNSRSRLPSVVF